MIRRRQWAALPAIVALVGLAGALGAYHRASSQQAPGAASTDTVIVHDAGPGPWSYSGASSPEGYSPVQPIRFPHPKHVLKLGLNCVYCHYTANRSMDPGFPAMSTCMGCHLYTFTLSKRPEIVKLTDYWNKKQPIPWVRIHRLPEYVHFPHMRHVNAGVTCQTCHGQVQEMYQVYQYASLNMGWCVNCHVNGYTAAQGDRAAGAEVRALGPAGATSVAAAEQPGADGRNSTPGDTGRRIGPPLTDEVHRARYDCSVCHY